MTNKFREILYTILTNFVSVFVILILPLFFGDNHITQWYYQKTSILFSSYKNECMFIALIIGVLLCFYTIRISKRREAAAEKVIHEAFNYQEVLQTREKREKKSSKRPKMPLEII